MVPPGIAALPSAPTAIEVLVESKAPSELGQLLVEQTSNVTLPVSFASGSSNVAVSVGVMVFKRTPPPGPTSIGAVGAVFAVLFVIEPFPIDPVAAAFPTGVATSRTIGSLPGFVYPSASVSRWWTALDSVKRVLSAAG